MKIVAIEGIIGAGKSYFMERLEERLTSRGVKVGMVREPVEEWVACGILKRFYDDPVGTAYEFESHVLETKHAVYVKALQERPDVLLMERSFFTDRYVFMEKFRDKIPDAEMDEYVDRWSRVMALACPYPTHIVYVAPPLDVCMKRFARRQREGEHITPEFQLTLLEHYELALQADWASDAQRFDVGSDPDADEVADWIGN